MSQAMLVTWVVAAIVALMKGRGKLVAASIAGGVLSAAVLFGVVLSYAFGGYYEPLSAGTEALATGASAGLVWALTAPVYASVRLAKPWSWFARANYDPAKMRLAAGRYLAEVDRRGWGPPDLDSRRAAAVREPSAAR